MTEALDFELSRLAAAPDTRTVLELIATLEPELIRELGVEDAAGVLASSYESALRASELIRQATPESIVGALLACELADVEPGLEGHVYLTPFKATRDSFGVVWTLGAAGATLLAQRAGAIGLRADVVYPYDDYVAPWVDARGVHFEHRPQATADDPARQCVLVSWRTVVVGRLVADAFEVSLNEVDAARRRAVGNRQAASPWERDELEQTRKAAILAAASRLPASEPLALAAIYDGHLIGGVDVSDFGAAVPRIIEPDTGKEKTA